MADAWVPRTFGDADVSAAVDFVKSQRSAQGVTPAVDLFKTFRSPSGARAHLRHASADAASSPSRRIAIQFGRNVL